MNDRLRVLRDQILTLTAEYAGLAHADCAPADAVGVQKAFVAGETPVPYAGRVFRAEEVQAAVGSCLDFWLTLGGEGKAMERLLAQYLGVRHSLLVNSGSSANLIALSALTSHLLPGERRLRPGDEVITCAAGFPTTLAPIIQNGATAVLLDADPLTGNIVVDRLEEAFRPGKTKALIAAHALGNPFNLSAVLEFCGKHNIYLIEDNCDALGCSYVVPRGHRLHSGAKDELSKLTGSFGDLSTQSFYPPHHLTMGEGGAVNIPRRLEFKRIVESFRDWGRDCWCESGCDNTCGKRYDWQLGELPEGYDHKYIYSHLGYNLKPLDIQAAIGRVQMGRLPGFVEARARNWEYLRRGLAGLSEFLEFALPTHARAWSEAGFVWDESGCRTQNSWFGFLMLVRSTAPFKSSDLARQLDAKKIGNRMLFGGNLLRQPALVQLKKDRPEALRVVGEMSGADRLMREAVFVGTYPGLSREMLDYVIECITAFCRKH